MNTQPMQRRPQRLSPWSPAQREQRHRSRPESRLSTFSAVGSVVQRGGCGAPGAAPDQSARSARRARPLNRTALLAKPVNGINAPQRPDCVAGHVRFELRNVVANYSFESSRGFSRSEPNSGHGDHSRLSCSAGDTQFGAAKAGFCGDLQQALCTDVGHHSGVAEKARIGRDLFRSEDDPPAAKHNTIAQFALDFLRKQSVCGDHGRRA